MECIQNLETYANVRLRRRCENAIEIREEAMQMGVRLRCVKWWGSVFVVLKLQIILPREFPLKI
jgi:hypothetical protein